MVSTNQQLARIHRLQSPAPTTAGSWVKVGQPIALLAAYLRASIRRGLGTTATTFGRSFWTPDSWGNWNLQLRYLAIAPIVTYPTLTIPLSAYSTTGILSPLLLRKSWSLDAPQKTYVLAHLSGKCLPKADCCMGHDILRNHPVHS